MDCDTTLHVQRDQNGLSCADGTCHEDWISELPDQILGITLSPLETKEAASTCVFSHLLRNLWKLFSGRLNFEASDMLHLVCHIGGLTVEQFGIAFDQDLGKYLFS